MSAMSAAPGTATALGPSPCLTLDTLESWLRESANILRGFIDSSDFKNYIFGLLFSKRYNDVFDERVQHLVAADVQASLRPVPAGPTSSPVPKTWARPGIEPSPRSTCMGTTCAPMTPFKQVLHEPKHLSGCHLHSVGRVIANPPFSAKERTVKVQQCQRNKR